MFTRRKEIRKRLGPDGCEEPTVNESENVLDSSSNGQQELHFVRGQMQNALIRLRELEEQVKTIPQLEVKISILTQQKNQLVESVGIEKERVRDAERENGKLRSRLKDIDVLQEDNDKLMYHIQELESIVDKVNCEVRSIAAQTEYTSIRSNSLHINDIEYDSSGSASSSRASLDTSLGSRRRKRKPATRTVASGGFEYIENIVCYDRTCLRNVGIGTSTQTRDFGHQANMKPQRELLRVDKAVGNHIDSVSIAVLAKPESRDKRSGKSRAFQCDASTTPMQVRTSDQGTCCLLLNTTATPTPASSNVAATSSTQTSLPATVSVGIGVERVFMASIGVETSVNSVDTCSGPDIVQYREAASHVNWLGENSRSRRTQTAQVESLTLEIETQTDSECSKKLTDIGTDPIITDTPPNSSLGGSCGAISNCSSGTLSLPEMKAPRAEPREFDPFFNDENEIIYLFRSKSSDPENSDHDSEGGEGEMRTLICKETRDIAVGPDERDIQEEAIQVIQELMHEYPDDFDRILGLQRPPSHNTSPNSAMESTETPDSENEESPEAFVAADYTKDFGTSQECPLMTDIEERYELPESLIEECIELSDSGTEEIPKQLKREWFAVSSKPNSSAQVVDDFLSCAAECSSRAVLGPIINCFDLNGNCALHYAISHSNLDVVSVILRTEAADYDVYNKAGYTPVMLTALVEAQGKQDLSPLTRLFKGADLNLQSKKEGQTALMLACGHGRKDMVRLLLMNGCNVNAQDEEGSTALMCAAEHGHTEIVKLILDQPQCNASIEDHDGSTALSIAMDCGHRDIGVMLYAKMNF